MAREDISHPVFARVWTTAGPRLDRGGMAEWRRLLLAGLTGRVLEIGAGSGLNFAHYPPEVASVVALEPERHLRRTAQASAAHAPVAVDVRAGTAEALPCEDGSFDAVVCSLVLCSVRDQPQALREIRRVLKPEGELRFLEHVRAESRWGARVQAALDATVWPPLGGGCHTGRATAAEIARAGFHVEQLTRFRFPATQLPLPTSPHVWGIARRGLARVGA